MNDTQFEQMMNRNEARRHAADDRILAKWERWERLAAPLIGQLCREGRTVYYIVLGNGKIKEGDETELAHYLGRNGYL